MECVSDCVGRLLRDVELWPNAWPLVHESIDHPEHLTLEDFRLLEQALGPKIMMRALAARRRPVRTTLLRARCDSALDPNPHHRTREVRVPETK